MSLETISLNLFLTYDYFHYLNAGIPWEMVLRLLSIISLFIHLSNLLAFLLVLVTAESVWPKDCSPQQHPRALNSTCQSQEGFLIPSACFEFSFGCLPSWKSLAHLYRKCPREILIRQEQREQQFYSESISEAKPAKNMHYLMLRIQIQLLLQLHKDWIAQSCHMQYFRTSEYT